MGADQLVVPIELNVGDVILMIGGGHSFRMLEDAVLLEIKHFFIHARTRK